MPLRLAIILACAFAMAQCSEDPSLKGPAPKADDAGEEANATEEPSEEGSLFGPSEEETGEEEEKEEEEEEEEEDEPENTCEFFTGTGTTPISVGENEPDQAAPGGTTGINDPLGGQEGGGQAPMQVDVPLPLDDTFDGDWIDGNYEITMVVGYQIDHQYCQRQPNDPKCVGQWVFVEPGGAVPNDRYEKRFYDAKVTDAKSEDCTMTVQKTF